MSKTNKAEISIPNMRGRKKVMKTKRLSNKKIRRANLDTPFYELKLLKNKLILDK